MVTRGGDGEGGVGRGDAGEEDTDGGTGNVPESGANGAATKTVEGAVVALVMAALFNRYMPVILKLAIIVSAVIALTKASLKIGTKSAIEREWLGFRSLAAALALAWCALRLLKTALSRGCKRWGVFDGRAIMMTLDALASSKSSTLM